MRIPLYRASDENYVRDIEVNTIEDLLSLVDLYDENLIIGKLYDPRTQEHAPGIEIYDEYIE